MFTKMRQCLNDFTITYCKLIGPINEFTEEDQQKLNYFYLDFAKAMIQECPDADKIAKVIMIEMGGKNNG